MEDWRKYADIIDMEHPEPRTHPRMSAMDRAGQFAPFAALTGYDSMVEETARLTGSRIEPDEQQRRALDEVLTDIVGRIAEHPKVRIVHFVPDRNKAGGRYETLEGQVRNVELPRRQVILKGGQAVCFDDILLMSAE